MAADLGRHKKAATRRAVCALRELAREGGGGGGEIRCVCSSALSTSGGGSGTDEVFGAGAHVS